MQLIIQKFKKWVKIHGIIINYKKKKIKNVGEKKMNIIFKLIPSGIVIT